MIGLHSMSNWRDIDQSFSYLSGVLSPNVEGLDDLVLYATTWLPWPKPSPQVVCHTQVIPGDERQNCK